MTTACQLVAESTVICVRKTVAVKKQKLKFQNFFKSDSSECPKGYVAIFQERTGDQVVADLASIDGKGSKIDADFLDGISSESFVRQSELKKLGEAVETLSSRTTALKGSLEDLDYRNRIEKIITVGKVGGDFQDITSALESLDTPEFENPYLIKVGPGLYSITDPISVPAGVTISGAGQQRTILEGAFGSATALGGGLVRLEDGSMLSNLTVVNNPAQDVGVAVVVENTIQAKLNDPTSFRTLIKDCQIIGKGNDASSSYAVLINSGSLRIASSTLSVNSTTSSSYGITFLGGLNSRLILEQSTIVAEGIASGVGIDVLSLSARARLDRVDIYGSSNAIRDSLGLAGEVYSSKLRAGEIGVIATGALSVLRIFYSGFEAPDHVSTLVPAEVSCSFASDIDSGAVYTSACE